MKKRVTGLGGVFFKFHDPEAIKKWYQKHLGIEVVGEIEEYSYGKFGWIMDPDGNKVELWEPMLWDDKNKDA